MKFQPDGMDFNQKNSRCSIATSIRYTNTCYRSIEDFHLILVLCENRLPEGCFRSTIKFNAIHTDRTPLFASTRRAGRTSPLDSSQISSSNESRTKFRSCKTQWKSIHSGAILTQRDFNEPRGDKTLGSTPNDRS